MEEFHKHLPKKINLMQDSFFLIISSHTNTTGISSSISCRSPVTTLYYQMIIAIFLLAVNWFSVMKRCEKMDVKNTHEPRKE